MRRFLLPFSAGVLVALWPASPVLAVTFVVDSTADIVDAVPGNGTCATATGACTLRAAIQEANALSGDDTITVPAGTYAFTLVGTEEDASATGDLDVSSVIVVNGAGAPTTIIDANGVGRAFEVHAGGNLTLTDVTVRNGSAESSVLQGGGLVGGGLLGGHGSILTLMRTIVEGNTAGPNGDGGGIGLAGVADAPTACTIIDSTITGNVARSNGGISVVGQVALTISRSTISSNTAASQGGGIGLVSPSLHFEIPNVMIRGSTFSGNTADVGGAIVSRGDITIANTTISGNSATSEGGALAVFAHTTTLVNVTLASNSSGTLGAVVVNGARPPLPGAALWVQNSMIANNPGPANCFIDVFPHSQIHDVGHNLEFPGDSCSFNLSTDVRADPRLAPLANDGGPTRTHALTLVSPAIDAGDDAACAAAPVNGLDQRGIERPFATHCDIGAFELTTPPHATLAVDFGPAGLWALHNSYAQLHTASPDAMATGDVDGNGQADLIANFPGFGVWVWINNSGWYRLHTARASVIATGDLDGNGQDEILLVFPGFASGSSPTTPGSTNYTIKSRPTSARETSTATDRTRRSSIFPVMACGYATTTRRGGSCIRRRRPHLPSEILTAAAAPI